MLPSSGTNAFIRLKVPAHYEETLGHRIQDVLRYMLAGLAVVAASIPTSGRLTHWFPAHFWFGGSRLKRAVYGNNGTLLRSDGGQEVNLDTVIWICCKMLGELTFPAE